MWSTLTASEQWSKHLDSAQKSLSLASYQVDHFRRRLLFDDKAAEFVHKYEAERDVLERIIEEIKACAADPTRKPQYRPPTRVIAHNYFNILPTAAPKLSRRELRLRELASANNHTDSDEDDNADNN